MISVIIPLYNKKEYIKRCVDSVLSQNFSDFEIVVVDDGSTDGGANILNEYSSSNLLVYSKENGGVSSARNYGVKKCRGDWVLFLDADDILLPGTIKRFADAISYHPEYKVFISNFKICDLRGEIHDSSIITKDCEIKKPLKKYWLGLIFSRPGNTLLNKDVFDEIGGYDESISYNEDAMFGLKVLTYYTPFVLAFYAMEYFKIEGSASMRIHDFYKNPISKYGNMSHENPYLKLLFYNDIVFNLKVYKNSPQYHLVKEVHKRYSSCYSYYYLWKLLERKVIVCFLRIKEKLK